MFTLVFDIISLMKVADMIPLRSRGALPDSNQVSDEHALTIKIYNRSICGFDQYSVCSCISVGAINRYS